MLRHSYLLLLLASISLLSCTNESFTYDQYQTLPNQWNKDSVLTFSIPEQDTLITKDIFLNLRNNSDYAYSNLFLIAKMEFPNGKQVTDTLEYEMAFPNGEYMGDGFGDVKQNKLWYKESFRFEENGEYKLSLRQAMRENGSVEGVKDLRGITEVGVRIENTSKTQ